MSIWILLLLGVHVFTAVLLIIAVLLQKSEGGALGSLGGGGGGGGMTGFMTARGSANLLTRVTAFLAGLFFVTSIVLTMRLGADRAPHSIVDQPSAPAAPTQPAAPPQPSVPLR
jgi:preprotein translocase subunit SecG